MKTCTIVGDLSSDKARDNYPTENFCDECFEGMDSESVVTSQDYDSAFGEACFSCGKTAQEEASED